MDFLKLLKIAIIFSFLYITIWRSLPILIELVSMSSTLTFEFYFYNLPKIFPIFLFALSLTNTKLGFLKPKLFYLICFGFSTALMLTTPIGDRLAFADSHFTVISLVEWTIMIAMVYGLTYQKTESTSHSLYVACFSVLFAADLYEIPVNISLRIPTATHIIYHSTFPLWISTKLLALPFLLYQYYQLGWRPNKTIYIALILFALWSAFYFLFPSKIEVGIFLWLPRMAAVLLFMALTTGISDKHKKEVKQ